MYLVKLKNWALPPGKIAKLTSRKPHKKTFPKLIEKSKLSKKSKLKKIEIEKTQTWEHAALAF